MTRQQAIALNNINHFIGLETVVRELEKMANTHVSDRYPPHNILKIDENKYVVELATAGFSADELSVIVEDKVLKISGNKEADSREYLTKGISTKSFVKTIPLIDTVVVQGAEYVNGVLRVSMENVIPEERKPKVIPILGMVKEQVLLTE